jgi:hypothetical protein
MSEEIWPKTCRHLSGDNAAAVMLEPYAVVTLKNVPEWQNKLHLQLDFTCTLCPLCAAHLTHFVGETGRLRPPTVEVHCEGCDLLLQGVTPGWLTVQCGHCGRVMVNEEVERELERQRKDG